jgi:hypothetical protein
MNESLKKDLHWSILGKKYVVRNVPYEIYDAESEEFLDLDVVIKLAMIRDLMYENKIPHDIDFEEVADLEF